MKSSNEYKDQPIQLFTFQTVEDFWLGFERVPRIEDVFHDSSKGARCNVERENPDGTKVVASAEGYMLFRERIEPDWKSEIVPEVRVTNNGYRSRLALSTVDLSYVTRAWECLVLSTIGELIDPAECVNGVIVTDTHKGKTTSLTLEIWFAVRDDKICEAICEEYRNEVNGEMDRLHSTLFFPKFTKIKERTRTCLTSAVCRTLVFR